MKTLTERKKMRKKNRKEKKMRKNLFYTSKNEQKKQNLNKVNKNSKKSRKQKSEKVKNNPQNQQQQIIEHLENRLNINKNPTKKSKMATSLGFDADLFQFLDNITTKVKNKDVKKQKQKQKIQKQQLKKQEQQRKIQQQIEIKEQIHKKEKSFDEIDVEINRKITGLFNKLSDGNIMLTFRQISSIFDSYSRSHTIPIFVSIFIKCNIDVQKSLLHLLLTNTALVSGLHYIVGDRLMYVLIHSLTIKFNLLQQQKDNYQQIKELGYSKNEERKKNFIIIICYLYEYGSLSGKYIISVVRRLAQQYNLQHNMHNIEFMYLIIQHIGINIRQNDPSLFKEILETIKDIINDNQNQHQKIKYLKLQINQLKFNRKKNQIDNRMTFLKTFVYKTVPNEVHITQRRVVQMDMPQMLQANINTTNWWEQNQAVISNEYNKKDFDNSELTEDKKMLLNMAKSLRFSTEIYQGIFMEIMQAHDYIEATQRILQLKKKNNQNILTVILQICLHQATFNPYYPLIAAKLCQINPKFRQCVQYALWDQLKQIKQYSLRKINNLAKFIGWFLSTTMSNGSLSMLKYFPDLSRLQQEQSIFMEICLKQFFKRVNRSTLVRTLQKLNEENNYSIKVSLKQYLCEMQHKLTKQDSSHRWKKMLLLSRKLLMMEKSQQ